MSPSVSSPQLRRMKSKATLTNSNSNTTDPLTLALQPPSTETPSERQTRLAAERQAKQRSDEIDKLLKADHACTHAFPPSLVASEGTNSTSSKKGRVYKMVLLGQAGAGKTTVLKQMRLLYDPQAHEKERRGWCKIVLLNLTASARVLLQTLERYHSERAERKSSEMGRIESAFGVDGDRGKGAEEAARVKMSAEVGPKNELNTSHMPWVEHISKIVDLERKLRNELGAFGEEVILSEASTGNRPASMVRARSSTDKSPLLLRPGWQERLVSYARRSFTLSHSSSSRTNLASSDGTSGEEENSEALTLLRSIQPDVLALWNDDVSCRSLRKRGMFLDGQSDSATSYFLDHYPRIVSPTFTPSDEDILHSRVRTLGVTEDVFRVDRSLIYRIYDVGGSRSQRAAWAPFLDDVESIIFLAPLSAFDQPLIEEPCTNRLADTFALFNQVVSNPLLRRASMILFLNKIDLLEKKLKQGVKLQRYWPEYDGDNDFEAVWRWFRGKFRDCCRRADDDGGNEGEGQKRRLYVHTTVATSTKQIRAILMSVKDSILRENLRVTGLVG